MFIILCDAYFSVSVTLENVFSFQILYPTLEDRQRRKFSLIWSWKIMSAAKNIIQRHFTKKPHTYICFVIFFALFCNDVSDSTGKISRWLHFKSWFDVKLKWSKKWHLYPPHPYLSITSKFSCIVVSTDSIREDTWGRNWKSVSKSILLSCKRLAT